jgi:hypothetical protein
MKSLKPVYLSHGAADYPKLATLEGCPEVQDVVTVALPPLRSPSGRKQSRKPIAFFNEQTQLLALASTAPAMFQPILATSPLSNYGLMSGVLLQSWEDELTFYQELILQLILDGTVQPEDVESKFNRVIKLASLGSQHKNYLASKETRTEAQLAAKRAISAAISLCKLSIPQETTTHVNR